MQRGEAVFDLARDFVAANSLPPAAVALTLAQLYVSKVSVTALAEKSWRAWSEDTFSQYARLSDPALLGKLLLDVSVCTQKINCLLVTFDSI